jgi:NitT/TauT family transport system substrate-binding protein
MTAISRRALLAGAGTALMGAACTNPAGEAGVIRVGLIASLSHAPVLAGLGSGRLARALAPLRIESRVFRAGPRVVEALVGRAIDFGVTGPAPVVVGYAHHGAETLRVTSGCASGGASLVVAADAGVKEAADFHGKALAVTQLGSTQDVSLRTYLRTQGLESTSRGGDVTIHALAASDVRTQMMKGRLAGAWLPEPWATRLVREIGAKRFVDERDLWPQGRFATALVVARCELARARPADAARFEAAVADEIERARSRAAESRQEAYDEIQRLTTNAGKREWFDEAWNEIEFTGDPLEAAVQRFAANAAALGVMPYVECGALFAQV